MLKSRNTFGVDALAYEVVKAHTEDALLALWGEAIDEKRPVLLLGEGSNVLFIENFSGTVLLNRIKGTSVNEGADAWHLHVGAGEVWHDLVTYCLDKRMPGLENLALIPGCVGSAPIQNIGAYGVEFDQFCEYVEILHLNNGQRRRLSALDCHFGYRDSIFKHQFRDNCVIVAVGLRIKKNWQPVLSYEDLTRFDPKHVTPRQIFDAVCAIRRSKLPDPAMVGNAGSFFKNPIVNYEDAQKILVSHAEAPHYPQPDGKVKLGAGWLIDRCQLKGYRIGDAAVHNKQALVLTNVRNATGGDIVALARFVRQEVAKKFAILLEPEVRFIAAEGEVDAVKILS